MALENNPLRQYFRRPAVYLKLPSGGKGYAPGVVEIPETGEIAIFPMTAIDEITTKTPDALYNGSAVTEIIKSCVPSVKDPWAINSMDLDALLIAIKAAEGGEGLEIESQCPSCQELATYNVNLIAALATLKAGDYDEELSIRDLKIKFRPLTYREMNQAGIGQFEVQKMFQSLEDIEDEEERKRKSQMALKSITELTMKILSQTIEYIKTPTAVVDKTEYILDFLSNCDKAMYIAIRDHNAKLKAQTEMQPLKVKCIHCGNEYDQPFTLNPSDFFG